ncbi:type I methionyl aminopeptidase [Elioraea rosea]|uniref:type I methionyl aminopeptidase n=1 Tax=Elioraea rosea TaxID=2492390 RepID=UPI0011841C12|nr:type I methionyl aminopeptidase [Elioraea rosea]
MTVGTDDELEALREIGAIVARTLRLMAVSLEPGMTTRELDAIGAAELACHGARPAPALAYGFPGATCISVAPAIAHGVPGERRLRPGDLVNIDVSAEKGGFFADTGASYALPPVRPADRALIAAAHAATTAGVMAVRAGAPLRAIGAAVEAEARRRRVGLVRNLASHGTGRALHEDPEAIPTWHEPRERRRIGSGMVFTIEPFVSTGARHAEEAGDGWTLALPAPHRAAQVEHTVVATANGAIVLTLPR